MLGCSTGEEAYSIAISFVEFAGDKAEHIPVQIFATDLSDQGIEKARTGLYSKEIAENVSPERLRRFLRKRTAVIVLASRSVIWWSSPGRISSSIRLSRGSI